MYVLTLPIFVVATLGLAVTATGAPAPAPDAGNLMELTVRVQQTMSGMAAIPPQTLHRKICMQAGVLDAQALANAGSHGDCRVQHYQRDGERVTFTVACTAPVPVTSEGTFHLTDGTDFTGHMHTAFSAAGHAVTVDTGYVGKRVGACPYHPHAST